MKLSERLNTSDALLTMLPDRTPVVPPEPTESVPAETVVVPLNVADARSKELGDEIYGGFTARGIETLLDDRDNSPGFKFKDADLIGIPYRVTIGEKSLKEDKVEIYERKTKKITKVSPDRVVRRIEKALCSKA